MGIVIRKTISTSIINYLGVLLGVVNVLWLQTAIISELQIGILSYIVDVSILLLPFILFGTSGLPARFIHLFAEGKDRNEFINLLFIIPLMTVVITAIVFFVFESNLIKSLGADAVTYSQFLVFIIPLVFCYAYQYLLEAILATASLTVFSAFLKSIFRRVVLIALLVCFSVQILNFYHLVLFYVFAHFIEVLVLFFFFKKHLKFKFSLPKLNVSSDKKKEIKSYAFYLIIGVSGVVMVGKIDSVMISGITDDFGQLGIYSIAFFIATVIELPKRIVHQLAFPIMSKNVTENKQEELSEMYKQTGVNMSIIGLFMFLIIWYNIDELFLIIPNGTIYSTGKWAVFFIGISKVLDVIFGTTDLMINATKHYKWNGVLIPILIGLTFITNYFFIKEYGIVGAAIATSLTVFVYSIIKYVLVIIRLKMNLISIQHIYITITTIIVIGVFYIKPIFSANNFIEIGLNSLIISFIFIGGNYILKSSKEMNQLIDNSWNKYIRKK